MSSVLLDLYHRDFSREVERKLNVAKQENSLYRRIKARDAKKKNTNIVVTGEPGDGKSSLSLIAGEDFKPEIFIDHPQDAVDRFVTFSGGEFGRAIKFCPDGSLIIGDEFGQQMHHRLFMSEGSVALSGVLQGFRFKRYKTFMNLPGLRYIDPDAQGLVSFQVHVIEQGKAEVYAVSHPKFRGEDFHHKFIDTFKIRKPRDELWKVYMVKKIANQERVFDRAIRKMDDAEGVTEMTDGEIAAEILKQPESFQRAISGVTKWDGVPIMDSFHIGSQRAYFIIRRLERGKAQQ